MTHKHIFDYEHCEEGHITSKHLLTIFEKLSLNPLFAVFYIS